MRSKHPREIKSYVLRAGRLTPGQARAIERMWPTCGVDLTDEELDFTALFGNDHPVVMEIGFGMGYALFEMAKAHPELNFMGVEVHPPGVGTLLRLVGEEGVENIRVCQADALDVLKNMTPNDGLSRVNLFFPDPWHKKKHHKRRIMNEAFINLVSQKLSCEGLFHMATDWEPYAEVMLEQMEVREDFNNVAGQGSFSKERYGRVETKFERRGERLGHGVWDLVYAKKT